MFGHGEPDLDQQASGVYSWGCLQAHASAHIESMCVCVRVCFFVCALKSLRISELGPAHVTVVPRSRCLCSAIAPLYF